MRKLTMAFGSFLLGAICMYFFDNPHTSTFLHPVFAQNPVAVKMEGAIPTVPPLSGNVFNGGGFNGMTHALDGTECVNCKFNNVTFEYG
jgi:hypothetical protein